MKLTKRYSIPLVVFPVLMLVLLFTRNHLLSLKNAPAAGFKPLAPVSFEGLVNTDGKTLGSQSPLLADKIWVASFIFTRCAGPCPLVTNRMRQVQDAFKGEDKLRLLSFTVDPGFDTPRVLGIYADKFGADPAQWFFLTGKKESLFELSRKDFRMAAEDSPDDIEDSAHSVLHSTKLVLLNADHEIVGYYASEDDLEIKQLIKDVGTLLKRDK